MLIYFRPNSASHMSSTQKAQWEVFSKLLPYKIRFKQLGAPNPSPLSSTLALEASRWLGTSFDVDLWLLLTDLHLEWVESSKGMRGREEDERLHDWSWWCGQIPACSLTCFRKKNAKPCDHRGYEPARLQRWSLKSPVEYKEANYCPSFWLK